MRLKIKLNLRDPILPLSMALTHTDKFKEELDLTDILVPLIQITLSSCNEINYRFQKFNLGSFIINKHLSERTNE